jgi:hypothetical protein
LDLLVWLGFLLSFRLGLEFMHGFVGWVGVGVGVFIAVLYKASFGHIFNMIILLITVS